MGNQLIEEGSNCACGCNKATKSGNKFILGHGRKGTSYTMPKSTRDKISLANKGKKRTLEQNLSTSKRMLTDSWNKGLTKGREYEECLVY